MQCDRWAVELLRSTCTRHVRGVQGHLRRGQGFKAGSDLRVLSREKAIPGPACISTTGNMNGLHAAALLLMPFILSVGAVEDTVSTVLNDAEVPPPVRRAPEVGRLLGALV